MDDYIDELNSQQREAVRKIDGPVLVLAGAGSGKTKTLTYRIAYLINDKHINPLHILAVTFTNKAANEMRERIYHLVGDVHIPFLGTFHSICVKLLKREGEHIGVFPNFTIYDTNDALEAVKKAMELARISVKDYNPRKIYDHISSCKNELISPEDYFSLARTPVQEAAAQIYPLYMEILKEANALDFDDLIMKTVELFSYKEILEKYQNQLLYILVDEYQDTNHAQYMLIKKLAEKHKNIYCVGDPDQNIYTFRGATIDNILNFEKDYPNCIVIKLEQNYRSTKNILKAAHEVISKNVRRKEKEMWTDNYEGSKIKRYVAQDEKDEAYFIIQKIKQIGDYSQCVVLYRTNAQSRALEEIFLQEAIPYKLVGGLRFYDRKEIKDILSYLRLLYNNKDDIALQRVINIPPRKIGTKSVEALEASARNQGLSMMEYLLLHEKECPTNIRKFAILVAYLTDLIEMNSVNLSQFMNILIEKVGYIEYLEQEEESVKSRVENIQELHSVASRYTNQDLQSGLIDFLENVALVEQESELSAGSSAVTLMSVHSAKGLEFDTVFLVGMEEGLFPHSNSMYDPDEMEEERRLCYVGMTRAKKELYLLNAGSRVIYGAVHEYPPSRFIRDVPDHLIMFEEKFSGYNSYGNSHYGYMPEDVPGDMFQKGDCVIHPVFQSGVVLESVGDSVTIRFDRYGVKKLMLSFARGLKKVTY